MYLKKTTENLMDYLNFLSPSYAPLATVFYKYYGLTFGWMKTINILLVLLSSFNLLLPQDFLNLH